MEPARNEILAGPLRKAVLHVAVPAILFQLLILANNFVDYFWVQLLGEEAAAGQSAAWTSVWLLASLGQIFSIGTVAVVARRVGEGKHDDAVHAATHAVRGAVLAGVIVGSLGQLLVPLVVGAYASTGRAADYSTDYLRTCCVGTPFLCLFYALEGTFKGHGDMRRPMRAMAMALLLNMVLDPVLIHVLGLEVFGAALATQTAFGLTGLLLGYAALRRRWLHLRGLTIDFALVGRVLRIGAPVSVFGMVFSLVYIFIMREVSLAGGDDAVAAVGLGLRIEGFAYMTSVGFASGAAAVVGQNLGAGQVRRANDGAWTAVRLGVLISGLWGLLVLIAPPQVVALLTPSTAATGHAIDYFRIVAASMAFMAVEIVLEGAFSGAGNTLPPMFLGIPLTLVRIPAAIVVRRLGWGVPGIVWALTLTSVVRGLLFGFWFARGRWVRAKA